MCVCVCVSLFLGGALFGGFEGKQTGKGPAQPLFGCRKKQVRRLEENVKRNTMRHPHRVPTMLRNLCQPPLGHLLGIPAWLRAQRLHLDSSVNSDTWSSIC